MNFALQNCRTTSTFSSFLNVIIGFDWQVRHELTFISDLAHQFSPYQLCSLLEIFCVSMKMKEIFPKKILKILFTLERLIPKCESSLWFAWKGMATIWVNFYFLFSLQCFCNAFLVINKTLSVSSHKNGTELAFFLKK